MNLKCPNNKCKYSWNYNGQAKFYATCPRCLSKVKIKNSNPTDQSKEGGDKV